MHMHTHVRRAYKNLLWDQQKKNGHFFCTIPEITFQKNCLHVRACITKNMFLGLAIKLTVENVRRRRHATDFHVHNLRNLFSRAPTHILKYSNFS